MNLDFFTSQLQDIKDLKERNSKFHLLSDKEKRQEIAFDCLQLILLGNLKGSNGSYWGEKLEGQFRNKKLTPSEFQEKLISVSEETTTCSVCARGGLMLSQIRLGNNLSFCIESTRGTDNEMRWGKRVRSNIEGFKYSDFKLMEREYESREFNHPYRVNTSKKLANICMNVIINGNFKLSDKTDYLVKYDLLKFFKSRKKKGDVQKGN